MLPPSSQPDSASSGAGPIPPKPGGRLRWTIVTLLFLATALNYLDRYAFGYLAPDLKKQFHWTPSEYGWVVFAFSGTYAFCNLPWGIILDRIGLRLGFSAAVIWWSLASMGTALSQNVVGFGIWRALLGVGEAGNFPAAVKSIAEWFPQRERATATGILNAGANVGTMVAPVILFLLVRYLGWRAAFVAIGVLGFFWTWAWWALYRAPMEHARLNSAEREWILQDAGAKDEVRAVPWQELAREPRAWAFIFGKMFSDPVWAFFLFWLPQFLADKHHVSDATRLWILTGIYLIADLGSLGGGWTSSYLIRRGWPVNRARKTTMAATAILTPLVAVMAFRDDLWLAIVISGLVVALHQWWSSNLFTTTSDMFPKEAIGTLVGMGQVAGSGLSMAIQPLIGLYVEKSGQYSLIFILAAFFYPLAFLLLHTLAPRLDRYKPATA